MDPELYDILWKNLGGEKAGSYNSFVETLTTDPEFQDIVWRNLGGEKAGSFDSFVQAIKPAQSTPPKQKTTADYEAARARDDHRRLTMADRAKESPSVLGIRATDEASRAKVRAVVPGETVAGDMLLDAGDAMWNGLTAIPAGVAGIASDAIRQLDEKIMNTVVGLPIGTKGLRSEIGKDVSGKLKDASLFFTEWDMLSDEDRQAIGSNVQFDIADGVGSQDIAAVPGMVARFGLDAALAAQTGGMSYGIQMYGDSFKEAEELVKNNPEIANNADALDAYKLGASVIVGVFDKIGLEGVIGQSATKALHKKIMGNVLTQAAASGVKLTGEQLVKAVTKEATRASNILKSGGAQALKGFVYEGGTELGEQVLVDGLKLGINEATDKEIFDGEDIKRTAIDRYANAFAGGAVVGKIAGAAAGMSNTQNYLLEKLSAARNETEQQAVVQEIYDLVDSGEMSPEVAQQLQASITDMASVLSTIPTTLEPEQRKNIAELIDRRRTQQQRLNGIQSRLEQTDPALQDDVQKSIALQEQSLQYTNNLIREQAAGEEFVYEEEDGKYYQKLGETGNREEINKGLYDYVTANKEFDNLAQQEEAIVAARPVIEETEQIYNPSQVVGSELGSRVETPVADMVGRPVVVENHKGNKQGVVAFEDGMYVINMADGSIPYEIGTAVGVEGKALSDAADFLVIREEIPVEYNQEGTATIRGKTYTNNYSNPTEAINRDADGRVVSVDLSTSDGKRRTFRGQLAEDLAYQITLKQITDENRVAELEAFVSEQRESGVVPESASPREEQTVTEVPRQETRTAEQAINEGNTRSSVQEQGEPTVVPETPITRETEDTVQVATGTQPATRQGRTVQIQRAGSTGGNGGVENTATNQRNVSGTSPENEGTTIPIEQTTQTTSGQGAILSPQNVTENVRMPETQAQTETPKAEVKSNIKVPKVGTYKGNTDFEIRTPSQLNIDDVLKRDRPIKLYAEQIIPIVSRYTDTDSYWVSDKDIVLKEGYGALKIEKGDELYIEVSNPTNGNAESATSYSVYIKGRSTPISHFVPSTADGGSVLDSNHYDVIVQMKNLDRVLSGEIETPQKAEEGKVEIVEGLIPNTDFYVAKPRHSNGFESPQKVIKRGDKWLRLRGDSWITKEDYEKETGREDLNFDEDNFNIWGEYNSKKDLAWDIASNARVILKDKDTEDLSDLWSKQYDYITKANKERVAGKNPTPPNPPKNSGTTIGLPSSQSGYNTGQRYTRTTTSGKVNTYTLVNIRESEGQTYYDFLREGSTVPTQILSTDTEYLNSLVPQGQSQGQSVSEGVNEGTTGGIRDTVSAVTENPISSPEVVEQVEETNVLDQIINPAIDEANQFRAGKVVFNRFSQEEQRGIREGGEHHVNATAILSRNARTNPEESTPNEEQEDLLETYAKERGIWIEDTNATLTERYGEYVGSGEESMVYPDGETVVKAQNTNLYDDLQSKMDAITLHNAYFAPETGLEVIGFGRNADGDFQVIVRQPFIQGKRPSRAAIDDGIAKIGFTKVPTEDNEYRSDNTIVDDLHLGNVLQTDEGTLYFIDPVMRLNTEAQGYGGTRVETNSISAVPRPVAPPKPQITERKGTAVRTTEQGVYKDVETGDLYKVVDRDGVPTVQKKKVGGQKFISLIPSAQKSRIAQDVIALHNDSKPRVTEQPNMSDLINLIRSEFKSTLTGESEAARRAPMTPAEKTAREKAKINVRDNVKKLFAANPLLTVQDVKAYFADLEGFPLTDLQLTQLHGRVQKMSLQERVDEAVDFFRPKDGSKVLYGNKNLVYNNGAWREGNRESDDQIGASREALYEMLIPLEVERLMSGTKTAISEEPSPTFNPNNTVQYETIDSIDARIKEETDKEKIQVLIGIKNAIRSIAPIHPSTKAVIHTSRGTFEADAVNRNLVPYKDTGAFYAYLPDGTIEMHFDLNIASPLDPVHEAIHAYLHGVLGIKSTSPAMRFMQEAIAKALKNSDVQDLYNFALAYDTDKMSAEFFVELGARIAKGEIKVKTPLWERIKSAVRSFINLTGLTKATPKKSYNLNSTTDMIALLNDISRHINNGTPLAIMKYKETSSGSRMEYVLERVPYDQAPTVRPEIAAEASTRSDNLRRLQGLIAEFIKVNGTPQNKDMMIRAITKVNPAITKDFINMEFERSVFPKYNPTSPQYDPKNKIIEQGNMKMNNASVIEYMRKMGIDTEPNEIIRISETELINQAVQQNLINSDIIGIAEDHVAKGTTPSRAEQMAAFLYWMDRRQALQDTQDQLYEAENEFADASDIAAIQNDIAKLVTTVLRAKAAYQTIGTLAGQLLSDRNRVMSEDVFDYVNLIESLQEKGVRLTPAIENKLREVSRKGIETLRDYKALENQREDLMLQNLRTSAASALNRNDLPKNFVGNIEGGIKDFQEFYKVTYTEASKRSDIAKDSQAELGQKIAQVVAAIIDENPSFDIDAVVTETINLLGANITPNMVYTAMMTYSGDAITASQDKYAQDMTALKAVRKIVGKATKALGVLEKDINKAFEAGANDLRALRNVSQAFTAYVQVLQGLNVQGNFRNDNLQLIEDSTESIKLHIAEILNGSRNDKVFTGIGKEINNIKAVLKVEIIDQQIADTSVALDALRRGDLSAVRKIVPNLDNRKINSLLVQKRADLSLLVAQRNKEIQDAIHQYNLKNATWWGRKYVNIKSAGKTLFGASRAIVASMDMSATFVQAAVLSYGTLASRRTYANLFTKNPRDGYTARSFFREFAKVTGMSWKAFWRSFGQDGSVEAYRAATEYMMYMKNDIANQPYRERAGLSFSMPGDINSAEEFYQNNALNRIPLLGGIKISSEIHMSLILNFLKAAAFDNFRQSLGDTATTEQLEQYAAYLNEVTGGRKFGAKVEGGIKFLGNFMFAPRLYVSRVTAIGTGVRAGLGALGASTMDTKVGRRIVKDYMKEIAVVASIHAALLFLLGGAWEDDPESKSLGKYKVGDKTYDFIGGQRQTPSLAIRLLFRWGDWEMNPDAVDKRTFYGQDSWDILSEYIGTHLHPFYGVLSTAGSGKDFFGNPYHDDALTARLIGAMTRMTPISLQGLIERGDKGQFGAGDALDLALQSLGINVYQQTALRSEPANNVFKKLNKVPPNAVIGVSTPTSIKDDPFIKAVYKERFENMMGAIILENRDRYLSMIEQGEQDDVNAEIRDAAAEIRDLLYLEMDSSGIGAEEGWE